MTGLLDPILSAVGALRDRFDRYRLRRRWARLRALGMHIGQGVNLPSSTWIDVSHCALIRIEDWCGFGEGCVLLAHDGQMDEFLDAGRIGRVIIRERSHIGARCVVLAGVEIGPRTFVGANSVISRTLPPDSVCAGSPAAPLCSLDEYLQRHRDRMKSRPTFPYDRYDAHAMTPERRAELVAAVADGDAYLTGGWSATLRGGGGMFTTPFDPRQHPLYRDGKYIPS